MTWEYPYAPFIWPMKAAPMLASTVRACAAFLAALGVYPSRPSSCPCALPSAILAVPPALVSRTMYLSYVRLSSTFDEDV